MNLEKMSKNINEEFISIWKSVGPELNVDRENKIAHIYPNLFFSRLTKFYYTLRGYTAFIEEKPFL
jgi:hypothetical protein